ncbi:MAG: carboxylating nicotinate-nucleotide diphosphorylase [Pseudomonadota bacterium]|nr:carboxylating nicotinate-nucleotide diphosphorylase [Pseudomonadota bacterium]
MQLNRFMVRPLVEQGLREELSAGDTTGGFLTTKDDPVLDGQIYSKGHGIACGLLLADETIRLVEPDAQIEHGVSDGAVVDPGTVFLKIRARASTFFSIERAAIDWIQQLSGIATKVKRYVDLVKDYDVRITDTRKGWPGIRMVQKYAVRVGGAHNHIFNLNNCILIKDNHIKLAGSISEAVRAIRERAQHTFKIEVECESMSMVEEALAANVEVIMFDNLDLEEIRQGMELVAGRAITEASGGINEDTVVPVAKTGVDIISVGDLTHSVTAIDVSLDVHDIKPTARRTIDRLRQSENNAHSK